MNNNIKLNERAIIKEDEFNRIINGSHHSIKQKPQIIFNMEEAAIKAMELLNKGKIPRILQLEQIRYFETGKSNDGTPIYTRVSIPDFINGTRAQVYYVCEFDGNVFDNRQNKFIKEEEFFKSMPQNIEIGEFLPIRKGQNIEDIKKLVKIMIQ